MKTDYPLPASVELERAIIAGLLLCDGHESASMLCSDLRPSMFSNGICRHIFSSVQKLVKTGKQPDFVTVSSLIQKEIIPELSEIMLCEVSNAITGQHIDQLREISLKRGIIIASSEIAKSIESGDNPIEIYEKYRSRLDELSGKKENSLSSGVETMEQHRENIFKYRSGNVHKGLGTGWRSVDEYYRLSKKTLNILTGIPMSGKSEWLDHLMINSIVSYKWRWAVYSPESFPVELHFQKLAEKLIGRPMFGQNGMNDDHINMAIKALTEHIKLISFEETDNTMKSILARAKYIKQKYGCDGVIIDPYSAIDTDHPGESETDFIKRMLNQYRNFARINDVMSIIVAHPTKLQRKRGNDGLPTGEYPVTTAYDISGSAHWFNMADGVISIWRERLPESTRKNIVQVHIQKVKNKNLGQCGCAELKWDYLTGRFSEI